MSDDSSSTAPTYDAPEETPAGWAIRSTGEADWALEKIGQAKREIAEVDAQFDAAIHRLRLRRDALRAQHARTVAFFEAHLRLWAEPQKGDICNGRVKSRALLHGRIGWAQRTRPKLLVKNEAAFVAWTQAQGLGAQQWCVDMETIRAQFKATGEVPPGCDVEGGGDTFYVETEGENL